MSYILIDSETRIPVPLPLHTQWASGTAVAITGFEDPSNERPQGRLMLRDKWGSFTRVPELFNLEIISEEDYMKEQS